LNVEFYSWGACEEVTGSKHFIDIDDRTIMVDAGMFQGRRRESYEKNTQLPFDPGSVDAIILTHAHFDHCGHLPYLVKNGFSGNIYCTPATRDLTSLILQDSAHIQEKDAEFAHKKDRDFIPEPLYNHDDVTYCLDQVVAFSYRRQFSVPPTNVSFYDAGHILGSSLVVMELSGGLRIGFSGDLGRPNLPILRDPQPIPAVDYLILESTYGNRLHDNIDNAEKRLRDAVMRIVETKGKLIIPAFAVERTQELIYFLHLLKDQGDIPRGLPIFLDSPMAISATGIFRAHPECFDAETRQAFTNHNRNPFGFEGLHYTRDVRDSKELNRMPGPMIIISASGMCEAGRILHHLRNNIEEESNTILIVGFMAENTLGRKIVEKQREVNIFGEPYRLRAHVEKIDAFSAHSDYQETLDYLDRIDTSRLKEIFLVHGETDAQDALKDLLIGKGYPNVTIARYEERYQLQ